MKNQLVLSEKAFENSRSVATVVFKIGLVVFSGGIVMYSAANTIPYIKLGNIFMMYGSLVCIIALIARQAHNIRYTMLNLPKLQKIKAKLDKEHQK